MDKHDEKTLSRLAADYEDARPLVLRTRWFRRSGTLGMKVWRSVTRNFDAKFEIEHIEIACPNYTLTDRGPVIERKKKDDEAA